MKPPNQAARPTAGRDAPKTTDAPILPHTQAPSSPAPGCGPLTPAEAERLAELEPVIERGLANFVEVGLALLEISDRRLYRATHSTFKDYVEEKWKVGVRRAYQLCEAAEIVKAMPETVNRGSLINERQVRELAKVKPEHRVQVVEVAKSEAKSMGRLMTAKHIKQAAEQQESPPGRPADDILAQERKSPGTRKRNLKDLSWFYAMSPQRKWALVDHILGSSGQIRLPLGLDPDQFERRVQQWARLVLQNKPLPREAGPQALQVTKSYSLGKG